MKVITLTNGIRLEAKYMIQPDDDGGNRVLKADVKKAFVGRAERIPCGCEECQKLPVAKKQNWWSIGRTGKSISVGCVRFSPEDVTTVRKWLRRK